MIKIAFVVMLALGCFDAAAASFDCKKAKSKSELLVCADPELSAMDERLDVLVTEARKRTSDARAFNGELEEAWTRRQKCKDAPCVKAWYAGRIAEFGAPGPAPVASVEPKSGLPLARGRLPALGRKLGLEIPAAKADFLARYGASGGQCGAGKFRPLKEMYGAAAVSECWTMAPCPAPSDDLKCGVIRTGYDARNRVVIFMTQLQAASAEPKAGAQALDRLVRKVGTLGGKAPAARQADQHSTIMVSGTESGLSYQAMVVAPPEGSQFVIVSIAER